ncbi:FAD:protein FMN transferase [Ningiella sp. W23]|uniref:FAD:protein FMN transferase n=1 Tax=Ningiella sp. W23 TaxID=3023715 RepID=UPI00375764FC
MPSQEQSEAFSGKTMGTTYNIKYVRSTESADIDSHLLQREVDKRLIQINQLMSTYIDDSELSLLNQAPANAPFAISQDTAVVINKALALAELSQGALDITIGPIVNMWGFGPTKRPERAPSAEQLSRAQDYVGLDKVSINNNLVTKHHPNVYIDLSTIAKGYAVDELAQILESYQITNYLVEIGGEMRLSGQKQGNQDWLVAIEKPITTERVAQRIISIGNNAIATSGDYRNYFEEDGVRFSHLIDPSTGAPIQHNLVAVSVIAPTCIEADGLATALIVMGAEAGTVLAEQENIAAIFITKEEDRFVEYRSTAFERQVKIVE